VAVSLGGFVGATPWLGIKTWLCLGVAQLFRLNKPAILLGLNLFNPLVLPFVLYLDYRVGAAVLRQEPALPSLSGFEVADVTGLFWPTMVGCIPVGAVLSAFLFGVTLYGARRLRARGRNGGPGGE
jgi:uncharacterized protein (DUF2062 family)